VLSIVGVVDLACKTDFAAITIISALTGFEVTLLLVLYPHQNPQTCSSEGLKDLKPTSVSHVVVKTLGYLLVVVKS
jgi:hypothetical protein